MTKNEGEPNGIWPLVKWLEKAGWKVEFTDPTTTKTIVTKTIHDKPRTKKSF